jgi:hypothetical protein
MTTSHATEIALRLEAAAERRLDSFYDSTQDRRDCPLGDNLKAGDPTSATILSIAQTMMEAAEPNAAHLLIRAYCDEIETQEGRTEYWGALRDLEYALFAASHGGTLATTIIR